MVEETSGWPDASSIESFFLWKFAQNALPLRGRVAMVMYYSDMELAACQICFQEVETIEHVFLHCPLAQIIWKESP